MIADDERLLNYITPEFVHVMMIGRIVKSGELELHNVLEVEGDDWMKKRIRY